MIRKATFVQYDGRWSVTDEQEQPEYKSSKFINLNENAGGVYSSLYTLGHACGVYPAPEGLHFQMLDDVWARAFTKRKEPEWIKVDREWRDYPVGTKAKAIGGGYWIKTRRGWKWPTGSTFPTPGGDASGDVLLPGECKNGCHCAEIEELENGKESLKRGYQCQGYQLEGIMDAIKSTK